jgi:hypothetical protein
VNDQLEAVLARAAAPDAAVSRCRVVYTVGASPTGRTRLELDGAGTFRLDSDVTSDRRSVELAGTIEPERLAELLRLLADLRLWEVEHVRKRAPGEPEARIEVAADGDAAAATLWVSEVAKVPAFQRATDELLRTIAELSAGTVLEPGR